MATAARSTRAATCAGRSRKSRPASAGCSTPCRCPSSLRTDSCPWPSWPPRRRRETMPPKLPIFMDSQSTTPMDPRVLEVMLPYFTEKFGHPASRNHPFGWEAEAGVDKAREQIATLIGARDPKEVVFTSGGTESINLALKGVTEMYREKGDHILTTAIEQRASLDVCKRLERQGFEVTLLPVGREGLVDVETLRAAITDKTILISVMFANNEIGTIQPIAEIGKLAKERGIVFHTDATQAVGKIP